MTETAAGVPITGIDYDDERFRQDPYPEWARLREEARVHRHHFGGVEAWFIDRYDDVRAALADRRLAKDLSNASEELWRSGFSAWADPTKRSLLNTDPPDHTRLRGLVGRAFTARRIGERLRPRIERLTDELLDEVESREVVDLFDALAFPLPVTVISELLGVPAEDRARFRHWFTPNLSRDVRNERWDAGIAYLGELVPRRRPTVRADLAEDEQPDLISVLIAARDEHGSLSDDELIWVLTQLLIAGNEPTAHLIASGMLALLQHPDQLRLLRERPELGPSAVDELLRYTTPLQRASLRFPTEPIPMDGAAVPRGCFVSLGLASANRDPSRFPDPDRLDITRRDDQHLSFGHGIHHCLGAPLARQEAEVAFTTLLRRFPDIALAAPEQVRWEPILFLQALGALPVRLRAS